MEEREEYLARVAEKEKKREEGMAGERNEVEEGREGKDLGGKDKDGGDWAEMGGDLAEKEGPEGGRKEREESEDEEGGIDEMLG